MEKVVAATENLIATVQCARQRIQEIAETTLGFLKNSDNSKKLASRIAEGIINKNFNSRAMLYAFETLETSFNQFDNKTAYKVSNHIHKVLDQVNELILNSECQPFLNLNIKLMMIL